MGRNQRWSWFMLSLLDFCGPQTAATVVSDTMEQQLVAQKNEKHLGS